MSQHALEFSIAAVGSGQVVERAWLAGRPLLLLFHDQEGEATVRAMQAAVRARWPMAADVAVASVVNMSAIPFFLRSLAAGVIEKAYRDGAAQLPPGLKPADYVIILLDQKGALYKAFGVEGSGRPPVAILINGAWQVAGRFTGPTLVEQVMGALEGLLAAPAS
jgi:hypothetical protein